jgi:hypothetical protein
MKKITEVYKEYKIMPNLQMHQYRVAAVAMQICESLDIDINKENIIIACLLHDMGNIIKFRLDYFPEFNNPEGLDYWQKVKDDYILRYGNDEHHATLKIAKEIGVNNYILELLNSVDPLLVEINKNDTNFDKKICVYADNRVTPHGIVSLKERSFEAKKRYENHPNFFNDDEHDSFNKNMEEIEKQIFSHSKIKKEDINDESIISYLEILKNFNI